MWAYNEATEWIVSDDGANELAEIETLPKPPSEYVLETKRRSRPAKIFSPTRMGTVRESNTAGTNLAESIITQDTPVEIIFQGNK
jgi:hypothetical protein